MMGYLYVVARDYGFAPNPFYGVCTLATYKPGVRKSAQSGDWIVGISSKKYKNKLVYAMEVNKKISLDQYWMDAKFLIKRPVMNGSLKQHYGDNIYHYDEQKKKWIQEDSHHSNENGAENSYNLKRDTQSNNVIISNHFYYFGKNLVQVPVRFQKILTSIRGYKIIADSRFLKDFLTWLRNKCEQGYNGDPLLFENKFMRYDGVS